MTREITRVEPRRCFFQEGACFEENDRSGNTEVRRQRAIDVDARLRPHKSGGLACPVRSIATLMP